MISPNRWTAASNVALSEWPETCKQSAQIFRILQGFPELPTSKNEI